MKNLTDNERDHIVYLLQNGSDLPEEYKHRLFPPDKFEMELKYGGKERAEDILADTMAVPLQPIRSFGQCEDWSNMLVFGDNLQAMKTLLKYKERGLLVNPDGSVGIKLIYIDPPFGTGDEYGQANGEMSYSAKLEGAKFVEFLRKRLIFMRELLTHDGSIYVRIDYHFGHYVKVILDEVFGPENFRNELIINRFKRQLRNLKKFNIATDSLFFYTKSEHYNLNPLMRPRLCTFCGQPIEPRWQPAHSPGLRTPPERVILGKTMLPPRGRHWTFTQDKIAIMEKEGRIRINPDGTFTDLAGGRIVGEPEYLQTEDTPVDSNWTDLKGYVRGADYPTENHEELLERVLLASSSEGDLVLDAFAGSGTTLAVAEKLSRRWIGIDVGKLSIYMIQKRLLNLRSRIGNSGGRRLTPTPFTLHNAGLYDFSKLRSLPWVDWRLFALNLFQCADDPHAIGGVTFDGYRGRSDVLVFDHTRAGGVVLDYGFIENLHSHVGDKLSDEVFIIAPAASVGFLEDYIDVGSTRYYVLRIPYSIVNELHLKEFEAILQPSDVSKVNDLVEAVGFDFIQTPKVVCEYAVDSPDTAVVRVKTFVSQSMAKGASTRGNLETLSMILVDYNYRQPTEGSGEAPPPFEVDAIFYAKDLEKADWSIRLPKDFIGDRVMLIYIDIYGNEYSEVKSKTDFAQAEQGGIDCA